LNSAKSSRFGRKARALTTWEKLRPAASSSSRALSITVFVCTATLPPTVVLSRPLRDTSPDRNSRSPVRIAYEYGFGDAIHADGWMTCRRFRSGRRRRRSARARRAAADR
jgi:hypothetical protein